MPPVSLFGIPLFRGVDSEGVPLSGGLLYSYIAGTNTPKPTYADAAGTVPHTNPLVLSAEGIALVYLIVGEAYKLNLLSADSVQQPGWPVDSILVAAPVTGTVLPANFTFPAPTVLVKTTLAGQATLIEPGVFVAGRLYFRVADVVNASLGNSQGLTGFSLGIAATPDYWGSGLGRNTGDTNTNVGGINRSAALFLPTMTTDLVVTAEGGTFDATGQLTVTIHELRFS